MTHGMNSGIYLHPHIKRSEDRLKEILGQDTAEELLKNIDIKND